MKKTRRCHSLYLPPFTHDSGFCQTFLKQALEKHGTPEIFNTDQGSEFTATAFTDILKGNGISVSMDGRGIALYEGFSEYFGCYNTCRIHQSTRIIIFVL